MTKSRHSATRLRLSSLFRWLAMLCFIKLCLVAMLMLDLSLPGWLGGDSSLSENPLVSQQTEHQPEYQVNQQTEQLAMKPSSPAAGPESPEGQPQVTQHPSVSSVLAAIDRIDATHRDAAPEPQGAAAAGRRDERCSADDHCASGHVHVRHSGHPAAQLSAVSAVSAVPPPTVSIP